MKYVALILAFWFVGCGPQPRKDSTAPVEYYHVDPATAGRVTGVVRFAGKKPAARVISMNAEEGCEKMHPKGVPEEVVVLGKGGALANAIVYIKSGLESKKFEPPKEAVVLDQHGCMFVPRVLAIQTGQSLSVKNSDPVSHNIHPRPEQNREWNQQQSPGAPDLRRKFTAPEVVIPVRCNIHSWMRSYIAVTDHPYIAVTNGAGAFEWPHVPPGEYTVAVWHETLGELMQKASVAAHGEAKVEFIFREEK